MSDKPTVVIAGSVLTHSGYGSHARDIARALIKSDKYDVKIIPIRWGDTPSTALDASRPDDKIILDRIVSPNIGSKPDIFIHITIPNEFQSVGKYNIGITAGIETTVCRVEWIDGCNRMDLVLATSEHSKNVFLHSKYEKLDEKTKQVVDLIQLRRPVEVLFEGVNTDIYNNRPISGTDIEKQLNSIPEEFCFLFVGHWLQGSMGHDRKDVGMLIRVFLESFKAKKPGNMPALILKTSQAGFSIIEREGIIGRINDIRNFVRSTGWKKPLPNIYLVYGDLTDAEMNVLYNHDKVKALVSFTKGEGFGRPLLEFTTTGKPVIASGWSGQLDFLHPGYSVLLPGELHPVHDSAVNDWIIKDSRWFTVNYDVASQKLLDVHKRYDMYLTQSLKHRKYTNEKFSFDKMSEKLIHFIDNIETYAAMQVVNENTALANLPKLAKISDAPKTNKISLPKLTKA